MRIWQTAVLAGILAGGAGAALADKSEILFQHKSWMVEGITFDDGSIACLAEVTDPGESFSVWAFPDGTTRLQFYSEEWDFGESDTANLQVEIDRRSPWTLTDANLTKNSVLFDLPDGDPSVNFLVEVARGSTLHLRTEDGSPVKDYSLSGSSASIQALVDCSNLITQDGNPFK